MKRQTIEIHGVTFELSAEGSVEAMTAGMSMLKSTSVDSMLLFFLLREIQALNGALRETRPPGRISASPGIFPS